jgi:hypothetical protein
MKSHPDPQKYSAALARLNARQQRRNRFANISRSDVLREMRREAAKHNP